MEASLPGMALASDVAVPPDQAALTSEPQSTSRFRRLHPPASTLPVWLTQVAASEQPSDEQAAQEPDEAGLAPVELPGWLKSMQPTATMDAQAKEQADKDSA